MYSHKVGIAPTVVTQPALAFVPIVAQGTVITTAVHLALVGVEQAVREVVGILAVELVIHLVGGYVQADVRETVEMPVPMVVPQLAVEPVPATVLQIVALVVLVVVATLALNADLLAQDPVMVDVQVNVKVVRDAIILVLVNA